MNNSVYPLRCGYFMVLALLASFCVFAKNALGVVTLDNTFPAETYAPVFAEVRALAATQDGGVLAGGTFERVGALPVARLIKISSAGLVAEGWGVTQQGANQEVNTLAPRSPGGFWVGGTFTSLGVRPCTGIALLGADGQHDLGFPASPVFHGAGINAIVPLADGSAYIAGYNSLYVSEGVGKGPYNIVKLRADGSADPAFVTAEFIDPNIQDLVPTESGKLYVLGSFYIRKYSGADTLHYGIVRLLPDGTVDPTFTSPFTSSDALVSGSGQLLFCGREDGEGKLLVGGAFQSVGGVIRHLIARLNSDGSLDPTFTSPLTGNTLATRVSTLAVLSDNSLMVGGRFTAGTNDQHGNLVRLLSSGALDDTFTLHPNGQVQALLPTADALYIGGAFSQIDLSTGALLRIKGLAPGMVVTAPTIRTQPLSRTVAEGASAAFGVEADGLPAPVIRWYRVGNRASLEPVATGTTLAFPGATPQEAGEYQAVISNSAGTISTDIVSLTVTARPAAPVLTAWTPPDGVLGEPYTYVFAATGVPAPTFSIKTGALPEGLSLAANGVLSGSPAVSASITLTIEAANSAGTDKKDFHFTFAPGSAPAFIVQPQRLTKTELEPFELSVQVTGWPVPKLQWYYEGEALPGATGTVYAKAHTDWNNAGRYTVVATNSVSSVPSSDGSVNLLPLETRPGKLYNAFYPVLQLTSGRVYALASLADGSVFAAGDFIGTAGRVPLSRVARYLPNGTLAGGFSPGTGPDNTVSHACTDTGNRVVLAGAFRNYSGLAVPGIVRVLADGKPDPAFAIVLSKDWLEGYNSTPSGLIVQAITPAADDGIFACVSLEVAGLWRTGVVRFRSDGTVHTPIKSGNYLRAARSILATPEGGIVTCQGQRLKPDLTLDATFNTHFEALVQNTFTNWYANFEGRAVALDKQGRVYLGGYATSAEHSFFRLLADGTRDASYPVYSGAVVDSLVALPGGRLFVGGILSQPSGHLNLLDASGDLEPTWYPYAQLLNNYVAGASPQPSPRAYAAVLTAAGNLAVGGSFDRINEASSRMILGALYAWQRASQSVAFDQQLPDRPYTALPVALTATATSGLPVAYRVTGPARLDAAGGSVTLTGEGGTVSITAYQAGDSDYLAAAEVTRTFNVTSTTFGQTITFTLPGLTSIYGDAPLVLSASASSGLRVALEVVSGPGVLAADNRTLTLAGAGAIVLRATQPGDATYRAATLVEQTLVVGKAVATITLTGLSALYDGSPKIVAASTTPAGLPVSLLYDYGTLPPSSVGSYTINAVVETENYSGAATGTLVISAPPPPPPPLAGGVPTPDIRCLEGRISLRILSQTGYLYQLQESSTLAPQSWMNLGEPLPGTGAVLVFPALEIGTGQTRRFFRVVFGPGGGS